MAHGCGLRCGAWTRREVLTRIPGALVAAMVAGDAATAAAFYEVATVEGVEAGPQTKAYPIPAGDGVSIDKTSQVILVRFQGKVIAFNLACPHENNAVRWKAAVGRFECSKHDSKYSPAGVYTGGRATRNMDRLPISRNGDAVVVDLSRIIKSDSQAAEWAAAVVTV